MAANEGQRGGDHYKKRVIQHWDFVLANDIPYMEAQVMRYVFRWRDKGGILDLEKARHFLDKLIEWEQDKLKEKNSATDLSGDTGTDHAESGSP